MIGYRFSKEGVGTMLVLLIPLGIWQGFVMQQLWGWFVAPALSARPITVAEGFGIIVTAVFLSRRPVTRDLVLETYGDAFAAAWRGFVYAVIPLVVGWIVWRLA